MGGPRILPLHIDRGSGIMAEGIGLAQEGHGAEGWAHLEPFFFDEAVAAAAEERRRQKEEKEAEYGRRLQVHKEALDRITDYCPKDGRTYFTRFYLADFYTFDLDDECELPSLLLLLPCASRYHQPFAFPLDL